MHRSKVCLRGVSMGAAALWFAATLTQAQDPPARAEESTAASAGATVADEESSYSLGLVFGSQLYSSGLEGGVSIDAVTRGLKDALAGKALDAADKERAMKLMHNARERVAQRNRAAARAFLVRNATEQGVTTTATGLQYQVLEAGDTKAASPIMTDRVTVHYRGRLLDGTEFDNSDNHAQAATFGLNGVIKGWREALLQMKPGAKWRLFIPPELGYDANSPPAIPSGSLLIFDMELVKVDPPQVLSGQMAKPNSAPIRGNPDKPLLKQAPSVAAAE